MADEIRKFAVRLLEGRPIDDLDGGEDDQKGYMSVSHGGESEVKRLDDAAEEFTFLRDRLAATTADGVALESSCLVARTKELVQDYGQHLRSVGYPVYEVKLDIPEQRDRLRTSTPDSGDTAPVSTCKEGIESLISPSDRLDFRDGMENCRMVTTVVEFADLRHPPAAQMLGQIHRHLPTEARSRRIARNTASPEVSGDRLLDSRQIIVRLEAAYI